MNIFCFAKKGENDIRKKLAVFIGVSALLVLLMVWLTDDKQDIHTPTNGEEVKETTKEKTDPVQEKMDAMSLDEKVGQLFIAGFEGTKLTDDTVEMMEGNHLGGVILFANNMEEPQETLELVNDLKQLNTGNDIPMFLSADEEGGVVERLPGLKPLKSAAEIGRGDEADAYEHGALLAGLMKGYGMQLNFAPVLDIHSNPDNEVIGDRAFGTDAETVSDSGIKVMQGMQDEGVVTAVKHFPGHGDTVEDSHEALPVVTKTREELEANELIPFKKAVSSGADMVLMSHIKLPELGIDQPASFSKEAVDILREEWKYDGVIITDDLTMGAITDNYNLAEVTPDAVKAGVDILMIAHEQELLETGIKGVKKAVQNGVITEERLDESVRRVLSLKEKYGLDDAPVKENPVETLNKEIDAVYQQDE